MIMGRVFFLCADLKANGDSSRLRAERLTLLKTTPQPPQAPQQDPPRPRPSRLALIRRWSSCALLFVILAAGLYYRVANLGHVQQLEGDNGRDYMVVMDFVLDGQWPLLGPWRHVGDHAIGPGWYYTILPAMVISGFHPSAGAAFISLMATLMIFMCWLWVRRQTGSELTALTAATCLAFSAGWIVWDRMLWNPNILPLSTVLIVFLIGMIPRRPIPGLALYIMLAAILPQWHTAGMLSIAASLPPVAWVAVKAWPLIRRSALKTWLGWGAATTLALGLLYGPPILFELKPGPGNIKGYIQRSIGIPEYMQLAETTSQEKAPFIEAAAGRSVWYFKELANRTFGWRLFLRPYFVVVLIGWALLWMVMILLHLYQRRLDPSVVFLLFLILGYWLVCAVRSGDMESYFLSPVYPAPVLLSAWSVGLLLSSPWRRLWLRASCFLVGLGLLGCAGYLTYIQSGKAWRIHTGDVYYKETLRASRIITDYLYGEVGDQPYNLFFLQEANFPAHMHYLMRYKGNRPYNKDYYSNTIGRHEFANRIYIMTRGYSKDIPIEYRGLPSLDLKPQAFVDAFVYRLTIDDIPIGTQSLEARIEDGKLVIIAK